MNPQPQDSSGQNASELTWEEITRQLGLMDETLKSRMGIEGKGKIAQGTYERSKRRLRSKLYETYITQHLHHVDANGFTISAYPEVLDKAAHDEVFRTLLIKRVLYLIDLGSLPVLKKTELKLKNVQEIYEEAEKISPDRGGVTPSWSERKQREIRRNLAQEILLQPENRSLVDEYIKKAEEFVSSNPTSPESQSWPDGNLKLAFHFRYILSELSRSKNKNPSEETVKEITPDQHTETPSTTEEDVIETSPHGESGDTGGSFHHSLTPSKPETDEVVRAEEEIISPINQDSPPIYPNQSETSPESAHQPDVLTSDTNPSIRPEESVSSPSESPKEPEKPSLFKRLFGRK